MANGENTEKENIPVLVGFGQGIFKTLDKGEDRSPATVMADVASRALSDSGVSLGSEEFVLDDLVVVDTMHRSMENLPASVAELLGVDVRRQRLAPVSGHVPQVALNRICDEISRGESRTALLVGGEALRSARSLIKEGKKPFWSGAG